MKKIYNKPTTEITNLVERYGIMMANSEPESTENIGAKENTFDFEDEVDDFWGI